MPNDPVDHDAVASDVASERARIEGAIAALSSQRAALGDALLETALVPLRARLAALRAPSAAAAPAVPVDDQVLRQVTVLFLDVVGSTAVSRSLDPEDIHALFDGLAARATAIVERHRGRVLHYAGDSVMAVFGADRAAEDDAERAVLAALDLLDEGRRQGAAVRARHGHEGFDVRIGVHTGRVLLGGGVDAHNNVRGIAVNIAARLEQTAPAGRVRISRATHRLVRDRFAFEAQPPLTVKGIDEPIETFLVRRADARVDAAASSASADDVVPSLPLIGRDDEIARLLAVVDAAGASRTLRRALVVGEPGLGKSRLCDEFTRRLPVSARRLRVRASRDRLGIANGLVRDALASHCGVLDSDASDVANAKLVAWFADLFGDAGAELAALVGQFAGFNFATDRHVVGIARDGRQVRARALNALERALRATVGRRQGGDPLVLLFDDVHWADAASLDCIDRVAEACHDLPLVVACFARPLLFEHQPSWATASADTLRIDLAPLTATDSASFVDALTAPLHTRPGAAARLGTDASTGLARLRALLMRNGDGNPYHMRELLAMLVDERVVVPDVDGWTVDAARLDATNVPTTLVAVLQARIDALADAERRALQHDSVIGAVFWDEALRAISPDSIASLEPLERRALICRHDVSLLEGAGEYAFRHQLLHRVAYDTVLKSKKRALHRATAEWLVATTGDRVGEHLALIADHWERAGDAAQAIDYLHRATRASMAAGAYDGARGSIDRAIELVGGDDARMRYDLATTRLSILSSTGDRDALKAEVATVEALAERLDDDRCRALAARWRTHLLLLAGRHVETIEHAAKAMRLAEGRDAVQLIGALLDRAQAQLFIGDFEASRQALEATLPQARAEGREDLARVALNRLNLLALSLGDYATARRHLEAAIASARASGSRRDEGILLGNLGSLDIQLGQYERGRVHVDDALATVRAIGDRGSEPYLTCSRSELELAVGDPALALSLAIAACDASIAVSDRGCEAEAMLAAAAALIRLGRLDEADERLVAHERWHGTAADGLVPVSTCLRATLALERGRLDAASRIVDPLVVALDARSGPGDRDDIRRCFTCHRVLAARRAPRAREFLERAHALLAGNASRLADDDRTGYLGRIALHREIVDAMARHST